LFFCKGFLSLSPLCRVWSSLIGTCSAAVSTNHQHLKSYKLTQLSIKKVSLTFTIRHPTGKTEQQDLFLNFPCGLWNVVVSCRGEFFLRILPHVRCSSIFLVHGIFNMVDVYTRGRIQPHVMTWKMEVFFRFSGLTRGCKTLSPHWIIYKRISYFRAIYQIYIYVIFKNSHSLF
jgi:hypothetical protein